MGAGSCARECAPGDRRPLLSGGRALYSGVLGEGRPVLHQPSPRREHWSGGGPSQPDIQYGDAIIPDYTREQATELSIAAAEAAREADPTCFRIINSTGTWADYYMGEDPAAWRQTPYDYLAMLEDAGCEYEAIGLQYYHSGRDLLEIERDIERYARFKKPIHVTELQIPSSSEPIEGNRDWWGGGVGGASLNWHGDHFTESIQADWAEGLYTLLFSKPYVDAATWWDMSDPAFVPHGGILNEDDTPKESYFRLADLFGQWKKM